MAGYEKEDLVADTAAAPHNNAYDDLVEAPLPLGTVDPVYNAKARVLNTAVCSPILLAGLGAHVLQIQEIGMGWYQWQLFIVVGFGNIGLPCRLTRL